MREKHQPTTSGGIRSWSYSRLLDFEACAYKAYLKIVKREPDPSGPAAERGVQVHDAAERFVRGQGDFIPELKDFKTEFHALRTQYAEGRVSLEGEWATDRDWQPTDWKSRDAWCRMKLDALTWQDKHNAIIIDYKGLPLDTLLPTPTGWTTMGDVQVGDLLLDQKGKPCTVTGKSKVKKLTCYRLVFDDTSEAVCDSEHRWTLCDDTVKTVTELLEGDCIPVAEPLQLEEQELPLDPYVFGVWLADGKHTSGEISKPDPAIWEEIQRRGFELSHDYNGDHETRCRTHTVKGLRTKLNTLNVLGDKQIPTNYLRASYAQRLDLLRGIFDGDGSVNHTRKQVVLNTTCLDFAEQVKELLLSLGQRPLLSPYIAKGFGKYVQAYVVSFRPRNLQPFLLPRKANKVLATWGPGKSWRRQIKRIERIPKQATQCVMVDSPDHTFLCTTNFIPTHNTGKLFGNEVKHGEQGQLYTVGAFMRYPELQEVIVEFWYLDKNDLTSCRYTRRQAIDFAAHFHKRGARMTEATSFPPRPNMFSCRYCPFSPRAGGQCKAGV